MCATTPSVVQLDRMAGRVTHTACYSTNHPLSADYTQPPQLAQHPSHPLSPDLQPQAPPQLCKMRIPNLPPLLAAARSAEQQGTLTTLLSLSLVQNGLHALLVPAPSAISSIIPMQGNGVVGKKFYLAFVVNISQRESIAQRILDLKGTVLKTLGKTLDFVVIPNSKEDLRSNAQSFVKFKKFISKGPRSAVLFVYVMCAY